MDLSTLLPMLLTGAGTGLTCGVSCGACGNPMVNVFLAGYLFTHTDRMKKSLTAFAGYHIGKAVTVSGMCAILAWFGSKIVDEQGNLFGINLKRLSSVWMLLFVAVLIIQWIRSYKKGCGGCKNRKSNAKVSSQFLPMLLYGAVSGLSPCASLLVVFGYAASVTTAEAMLIGLSFSLANSLVPLFILTALTGLLSEQMHKEIPEKIQYFQLASLVLFACALLKNLLSA